MKLFFAALFCASCFVSARAVAADAQNNTAVEDFDAFVKEDEARPQRPTGTPATAESVIVEPAPDLDASDETFETDTEPLPLIRQKKDAMRMRFRSQSRFIEHPNAEKGLIKIDKNRVYIYKTEQSEQKGAATFRVGLYSPDNLMNPDNSGLSFANVYTEDSYPMLQYDYEKQFFKRFGKLGYVLGAGLYVAQGQGQFENATTSETPKEKFTLFVFPISIGLIYRAQFWDGQFLVPFAGGGLDYFAFAERRDDDLNPGIGARIGGSPAFHFNVGGAIKLGKNARSFLDLDREYGINSVWITGEYRNYVAFSDRFDFSSDFIGGGIYVEY